MGAVSFDKDAVYIDIGRRKLHKEREPRYCETEGTRLMKRRRVTRMKSHEYDADAPAGLLRSLQDLKSGVDEKMEHSTLRIFKGSKAVRAGSDDSSDGESDSNREKSGESTFDLGRLTKPFRRRGNNSAGDDDTSDGDDDEDSSQSSDEGSDSDSAVSSNADCTTSDSEGNGDDENDRGESPEELGSLWKNNLAERAAQSFLGRDASAINLQELIYGSSRKTTIVTEDEDKDQNEGDDSDDDFFKVRGSGKAERTSTSGSHDRRGESLLGEEDSSRLVIEGGASLTFDVSPWLEEGEDCLVESIRDKFVTGKWAESEAEPDEAFGEFEDFETGEKFGAPQSDESDDDTGNYLTAGMTDDEIRAYHAERKAKQKSNFDDEFDEEKKALADDNDEIAENAYMDSLKREKEARLKKNELEFGEDGERARLAHEGFRQGLYCRIRIDNVPSDFVSSFNPHTPLVIGGLTPQETSLGLIRCRFKKHRWHKRILKCNDPLVFSMGWRRFQSVPVFSTEDQNGRHRYEYCLSFLTWQPFLSMSLILLHLDAFIVQGTSSIHLSTCIVTPLSLDHKFLPILVFWQFRTCRATLPAFGSPPLEWLWNWMLRSTL